MSSPVVPLVLQQREVEGTVGTGVAQSGERHGPASVRENLAKRGVHGVFLRARPKLLCHTGDKLVVEGNYSPGHRPLQISGSAYMISRWISARHSRGSLAARPLAAPGGEAAEDDGGPQREAVAAVGGRVAGEP